jgi:hypothetical protein
MVRAIERMSPSPSTPPSADASRWDHLPDAVNPARSRRSSHLCNVRRRPTSFSYTAAAGVAGREEHVRPRWIMIAAVLLFGMAAGLGAIGDWVWWPVYDGIVITLAAGGILLFAVVLAVIPRTRTTGLLVAMVGVGLIAGQNLGPSRPALQSYEGTMTVSLTSPRASSGTLSAWCSMDAAGAELSVSGDTDVRLDILPDDPTIPADIDQREFLFVGLSIGDRWRQGATPRSDHVVLWAMVGSVKVDHPETRMSSAPGSTLELVRSGSRGTLSFSGLVAEPAERPTGDPIDLAGTLSWDCGDAVATK